MLAISQRRAPFIIFPVLIVVVLLLAARQGQADELVVRSEPRPIASFHLEDGHGRPFGNASFEGRWALVAIGFTSCPDVCPLTLTNLAGIVEEVSTLVTPENIPRVVFVSVDPDRDKKILAQYVTSFNSEFVGVTGDPQEIGKVIESLDGFYRIVPSAKSSGRDVQHSAKISVVDANGRFIASFSPLTPPREAAAFIASLMRERAKASG